MRKAVLYGRKWNVVRLHHLAREPYCRFHLAQGVRVIATVVDHIIEHKGDPVLFWDPDNRQSLCERCHNSIKQSMERGGRHALGVVGSSIEGRPLDPNHPWNK